MPGPRGRGPGGMMGGVGTLGGPTGTSGESYYRMIPPAYMGGYRRSQRDGLLAQTAVERLAARKAESRLAFARMQGRHGFLKGTIIAFKGRTIGGLRRENCFTKLESAEKDLKAGKITNKVYLKRCINAHKTYASYMAKIGFFSEKEYYQYMAAACEALGIDYEYAPKGHSK